MTNLKYLLQVLNTRNYNPSNSGISIEALTTMQTDSQNAINSVNSVLPACNTAIAAREDAFKPLSKLITRVMNALKAANPSAALIDNALTSVRKLQGRRASSKFTEEKKQELIAQGKEVNEISSSQLSFDNRIDFFLCIRKPSIVGGKAFYKNGKPIVVPG